MATDRGAPIPAISVGNLSVGGTGKTPIAANLAQQLRGRGARPAVVLRGYGADEPLIHALLNPDVPVFTGADRMVSARHAQQQGCDVIVLDDAFQHRRVQRIVDIVLVASERWGAHIRTLPTGPFREGAAALQRASMVLVTRKADELDRAQRARAELTGLTTCPIGIVALRLDELRRAPSADSREAPSVAMETLPLLSLSKRRVLAIAGVGEPRVFATQIERVGALVDLAAYPDHYSFTLSDIALLERRGEAADFVVCTLKDAVKLAPRWPRAAPSLWYVSQRIDLEEGGEQLEAELRRLLDARRATPTPTTG